MTRHDCSYKYRYRESQNVIKRFVGCDIFLEPANLLQARIAPILITRTGAVKLADGSASAGAGAAPAPVSGLLSKHDDVELWPQSRVFRWLIDNKFDDYTGVFAGASITGSKLLTLTENDLSRMGVHEPVRRQPLMNAIQTLHAEHVFHGVGSPFTRHIASGSSGEIDGSVADELQSPLPQDMLRRLPQTIENARPAASPPTPAPDAASALALASSSATAKPSTPLRDRIMEPAPYAVDDGITGSGEALAMRTGAVTITPGFAPPHPIGGVRPSMSVAVGGVDMDDDTSDAAAAEAEAEADAIDQQIHKPTTRYWKIASVVLVVLSMLSSEWLILGGELHSFSYRETRTHPLTNHVRYVQVTAHCYWDRIDTVENSTDQTAIDLASTLVTVPNGFQYINRYRYWHADEPLVEYNTASKWCFACAANACLALVFFSWWCSLLTLIMFALRQFNRREFCCSGQDANRNANGSRAVDDGSDWTCASNEWCQCLIREHYWWHTVEWSALALGALTHLVGAIVWIAVCVRTHVLFLSAASGAASSTTTSAYRTDTEWSISGWAFLLFGSICQFVAVLIWRYHKRRDERSARRQLMKQIDRQQQKQKRWMERQQQKQKLRADAATAAANAADEIGGTAATSGGGKLPTVNIIPVHVQPTISTADGAPPPRAGAAPPACTAQCGDVCVFLLMSMAVIVICTLLSPGGWGGDMHRYSYSFDRIDPLTQASATPRVYHHRVVGRVYWNFVTESESRAVITGVPPPSPLISYFNTGVQYFNDDLTMRTSVPRTVRFVTNTIFDTATNTTIVSGRTVTGVEVGAALKDSGRHSQSAFLRASIVTVVAAVVGLVAAIAFVLLYGFRLIRVNGLVSTLVLDRLSEMVCTGRCACGCCRRPAPHPAVLALAIAAAGAGQSRPAFAAHKPHSASEVGAAERAVHAYVAFEYYLRWEAATYATTLIASVLVTIIWAGGCYVVDSNYVDKYWIDANPLFARADTIGVLSSGDGNVWMTGLAVMCVVTASLIVGAVFLLVIGHSRDREFEASRSVMAATAHGTTNRHPSPAALADALSAATATATAAAPIASDENDAPFSPRAGAGGTNSGAVRLAEGDIPMPATIVRVPRSGGTSGGGGGGGGGGGFGRNPTTAHASGVELTLLALLPPAQQHPPPPSPATNATPALTAPATATAAEAPHWGGRFTTGQERAPMPEPVAAPVPVVPTGMPSPLPASTRTVTPPPSTPPIAAAPAPTPVFLSPPQATRLVASSLSPPAPYGLTPLSLGATATGAGAGVPLSRYNTGGSGGGSGSGGKLRLAPLSPTSSAAATGANALQSPTANRRYH